MEVAQYAITGLTILRKDVHTKTVYPSFFAISSFFEGFEM